MEDPQADNSKYTIGSHLPPMRPTATVLISTYSLYWEEVSMTETRDGALMSFNKP